MDNKEQLNNRTIDIRSQTGEFILTHASTGTYSFLRTPKQYDWQPKEDITVYELALCVPVFQLYGLAPENKIESLPEKAKRHFKEIV